MLEKTFKYFAGYVNPSNDKIKPLLIKLSYPS